MPDLEILRDVAWVWVAAPVLLAVAVWLTVRLAAPQLLRLLDGVRAVRAHDPEAPGEMPPAASVFLATAGSYGAAAAVGAATAVALGGAGVLLWVWIIGLVVAPLRFAETLLARTSPPGAAKGAVTGSLPARLMADRGVARGLGFAACVLVIAAAFAFVGGVHGVALTDAASQLLPTSMPVVGFGVAALAAILAAGGARRVGTLAGWLGLAAVLVLLLAAAWAAASEPSRAFGALGRAFTEAFSGAPAATPFVGAFAGEVAFAAVLNVLPPIAATTGTAGALHAAASARTTRGQAAASLLGPLIFAVLTTVLCAAFVATGAYYRRVDDSRSLADVQIYGVSFETASQRVEPERLYEGYLRIVDGTPRDVGPLVGTPRGMVRNAKFVYQGEPADLALHVRGGAPFRMLLPKEGVLREVPISEAAAVRVDGEMLPRGGSLLASALTRGTGGEVGPRLALGALLVLLAVGAAGWGIGAARALRPGAPAWARMAVAILPAAGLALGVSGVAPWLEPVGGIVAAAAAVVVSLALALKSAEARALAGGRATRA